MSSIDWMLVTSANLSKQAWGEAMNSAGEIRVCSYEIGVIVWPELYGDDATMIPTFKTDSPPADLKTKNKIVVGARMPYDLPLVPYKRGGVPWCATASYTEPDVRIFLHTPLLKPFESSDGRMSCSPNDKKILTQFCSGWERYGGYEIRLGIGKYAYSRSLCK